MTKKLARTYSQHSLSVAALLGKMITLARKERKMSAADVADRAGITRTTLRRIENGDMGSEIGIVFEVATIVGVTLLSQDTTFVNNIENRLDDKLALLPSRIHRKSEPIDDQF